MSQDRLDLDSGLRDLASLLLAEETVATTLEQITAIACRCLDDGIAVSVTRVRSGTLYTAHASDERVTAVDQCQYEANAGPAVAAIASGELQVAAELGADDRWPALVAPAAALGIRGAMSVPLTIRDDIAGSLNLYAQTTGAFAGQSGEIALLIAIQASATIINALVHEECMTKVEQLQGALDSRVVIEQAKGVLMERHACDADSAFSELRAQSQRSNRRIQLVAAEVLDSISR